MEPPHGSEGQFRALFGEHLELTWVSPFSARAVQFCATASSPGIVQMGLRHANAEVHQATVQILEGRPSRLMKVTSTLWPVAVGDEFCVLAPSGDTWTWWVPVAEPSVEPELTVLRAVRPEDGDVHAAATRQAGPLQDPRLVQIGTDAEQLAVQFRAGEPGMHCYRTPDCVIITASATPPVRLLVDLMEGRAASHLELRPGDELLVPSEVLTSEPMYFGAEGL